MTSDAIKIKSALFEIGIQINDIYDLVNTSKPYPEAVPILIDCLKEGLQNDGVKEGVIRALAVKEARGKAGKVLIEEYYKTPKEKSILRWTIGNTMDVVISDNDIQEVLKIVQEKDNGLSRQMFVLALGKVRSEEVEQVLINLLDDDEVTPHAIDALVEIKSTKAKEKISKLLNHPNPLIKKEAQKAMINLES